MLQDTVYTRLDETTASAVRTMAARTGLTISTMVRVLVKEALRVREQAREAS